MKKTPETKVEPKSEKINPGGSPFSGAKVIQKRTPSGVKLIMETDSDCVLVFIGKKDISDKMGKEDGSVVYNIFHDGKRFVSMAMSYAFTEVDFKPDTFYYLHNQGEIQRPGLNAMKDFAIFELGAENEKLICTERIHPDKEITLTLAAIEEANYTRLNYPLR